LVVVAIISLLISILIPSLKQAKELAKVSVCASNLHNIGTAIHMYAAEYSEPPIWVVPPPDNGWYSWGGHYDLYRYTGDTLFGWVGLGRLYSCNTDPSAGPHDDPDTDSAYVNNLLAFFCPATQSGDYLSYDYQIQFTNTFRSSYTYRDPRNLLIGIDGNPVEPSSSSSLQALDSNRAAAADNLLLTQPDYSGWGQIPRSHRRGYNVLYWSNAVEFFRDDDEEFVYGPGDDFNDFWEYTD
jgi:type II secretory pathway pseudopilin PulG